VALLQSSPVVTLVDFKWLMSTLAREHDAAVYAMEGGGRRQIDRVGLTVQHHCPRARSNAVYAMKGGGENAARSSSQLQ
jgi:hypothetical protein